MRDDVEDHHGTTRFNTQIVCVDGMLDELVQAFSISVSWLYFRLDLDTHGCGAARDQLRFLNFQGGFGHSNLCIRSALFVLGLGSTIVRRPTSTHCPVPESTIDGEIVLHTPCLMAAVPL